MSNQLTFVGTAVVGIALGLLLGVNDGDCVGVRVVGMGVGAMDGEADGV